MIRIFKALAAAAVVLLAPAALSAQAAAYRPLVNANGTKQLPNATTLQTAAPTTANASINLPQGAAPTTPINGDVWFTSAGMFIRVAGSTIGPVGAPTAPGGSSGQLQYNNSGAFGGVPTVNGDGTLNTSTGALAVSKTGGVSFGYFATGVDAANLTGTVACARLPALTGDTTTSAGACATTTAQAAKWTTARVLSFTGDVTGSASVDGSGAVATALTIAAGHVTLAMHANIADQTILGNNAGGAGPPIALTASQARTVLGLSASATTDTTNATNITSGTLPCAQLPAETGDVVTSGCAATIQANAVTTSKINNSAVTLGKIANAAANTRFVGSGSAGSGSAYAEQTISAGAGVTITPAAGGITIAALGSGISGAAPYVYTNAPFANVTSLLHFDGTNGSTTITDQVLTAWTAVGTAAISTAQSVYGGASLLVPGSGNSSVKHTTSSGFDVGTGDWAIEFNWKSNGTPQTSARIFQSRDGDVVAGISLTVGTAGTLTLSMSSAGASFDILNNNIATLSLTGWNNVIVQRRGIFIEVFVNGTVAAGNITIGSSSIFYSSSDTVIIGGNATGTSRSMNSYIDDFRFTKGVYVMVPGNPGLPSSAFPNS